MNKKYLKELIKLVKKAIKRDEVPVAALIVYKNRMIAKTYNKRNKKNNVLMHAEIIAIKKASKKLNNWRLNECDLYVTMKPCKMCEAIIGESRIKNVYYLLENKKQIKYNTNYIKKETNFNVLYEQYLSDFFKQKR